MIIITTSNNNNNNEFSAKSGAANLCTNIMDFRGFDSSIILIIRAGIFMFIGIPRKV